MIKINKNQVIVIVLLLLTIFVSFCLPKAKYQSLNILKEIDIPWRMPDWQSKDLSYQLDASDKRYNFIGDIFARGYINKYGQKLLFIVLDAGNFHNPKVCFGSSGFTSKDLDKLKIKSGSSFFEAQTVYMQKGQTGQLIIYWLCIDKKIASWGDQKLIELWNSLLNKKKAGLMVRLDISTSEENIPSTLRLAQEFITDLRNNLSPKDAEYIFGK
jgi:EpsI family protein